MTELELELTALAGEIDVPAAPDLAGRVTTRIARRRRFFRLGAAAALGAAAIAVAFAVPPARSALLRFFHLRGVTIERVETLPAARERQLGRTLGHSMPLSAAERLVGFRLLLPPGARPGRARVRGELVSVVLERGGDPILVSEFLAPDYGLMKKVASAGTDVAPVRVGDAPGLWVEGSPHVLLFLVPGEPLRSLPVEVRGNVLLWQRAGLTLRLQGRLSRDDAIRLARTFR
jgi:hypothetical protein